MTDVKKLAVGALAQGLMAFLFFCWEDTELLGWLFTAGAAWWLLGAFCAWRLTK